MKKVLLAIAVATAFVACNDNNGTESTTKTDSPVVKKDSPMVVKTDSPVVAPKVDSPVVAPKTEMKKDSPAVKK
jgi:hypothetical protein